LVALVPVEIIAWLCLRPLVFLFLMGAMSVLFLLYKKRISSALKGGSV
jgi:hypothetical protein